MLGDGASVGDYRATAIGPGARTDSYQGVGGTETLALGHEARAEGWRCSAVGARSSSAVVSASAFGPHTIAWGAHMIAIGKDAHMERVEGSPELNSGNGCGIAGDDLYGGGRLAHKYIDRGGDTYARLTEDGGTGQATDRWDVATAPPGAYRLQGMDAYDARFEQDPARFNAALYDPGNTNTWMHRVDKDIDGGDLVVAAGRGTGTAAGGAIDVRAAPAGAVSQNVKNALRTALRIDTDRSTADATPMWMWDTSSGQLHRVLVGPPDSGGPGYRALRLTN
jgi:hypothetical protein